MGDERPGGYSNDMKRFIVVYRYELIAALSGAVVMMLELVGARMVAPYFGTSIYVWTAMIGVILGSLSFGYWYGGKLADRGADNRGLAMILSVSAGLIGLSMLFQEPLLKAVAGLGVDVRFQAVIAALFLFAPASCLLGIVSPYVVKLKLSSLSTAGRSVGQLYAAGTAGSIIGTFATGYWLISWFGNFTLGLSLVVLLLAVSFIANTKVWRWGRIIIAVIAVMVLIAPKSANAGIVADIDSAYSRYQVSEMQSDDGKRLRLLLTDNQGAQSGYIVGEPNTTVFDYIEGFKTVADAYGPMKSMLMIGGGAYTFPSMIARQQPDATVDVVEIDPKLDEIATKYFDFRPTSNVHLTHQDGRAFLNQNKHAYDLVYVDAFSSLSPPYQLATVEASRALRAATSPGGLAVANVIARPQTDDLYFAATYHTYRQVFESVKIYRVQASADVKRRQNLLFVMGDSSSVARISKELQRYSEVAYPSHGQLLRDDHAPVDQLINASVQ